MPGIEFTFFPPQQKGHIYSVLFHCLRKKQDGQIASVGDLSLMELVGMRLSGHETFRHERGGWGALPGELVVRSTEIPCESLLRA